MSRVKSIYRCPERHCNFFVSKKSDFFIEMHRHWHTLQVEEYAAMVEVFRDEMNRQAKRETPPASFAECHVCGERFYMEATSLRHFSGTFNTMDPSEYFSVLRFVHLNSKHGFGKRDIRVLLLVVLARFLARNAARMYSELLVRAGSK